jgi:hypothetical protein
MKDKKCAIAAAVVLALIAQGCASSALNRKIDNEMAQETSIKTHADLRNETGQLIQTAPGLTAEQRSKLATLRDSTRAQLDTMWMQSLKLRSLLLKDLVSANYDVDEVELIKRRIRDLESKRLTVTFDAVEQANQILGHETYESRQRIMDAFFEGHRGGWDRD